MERSYHLGLVKSGDTVIIEVADTVDELSCETWKYLGERIQTIEGLRKSADFLCNAINEDFGTRFTRATVRRIASGDLSAGHHQVYA